MPASILFVHQGYELYGSDRTLIQSVHAAAFRWPKARITVLLPREGDLRTALLLSLIHIYRAARIPIQRAPGATLPDDGARNRLVQAKCI